MTPCLIDTNVLVYARHAGEDAAKHAVALGVLSSARDAGQGWLSTQVLVEYFDYVARRGGRSARSTAWEHIRVLAAAFPVVSASPLLVLAAAQAARRHELRIYDAMIWAAAASKGIPVVLSEDLAHRCSLGGVTFLNPFADDFELSEIGL